MVARHLPQTREERILKAFRDAHLPEYVVEYMQKVSDDLGRNVKIKPTVARHSNRSSPPPKWMHAALNHIAATEFPNTVFYTDPWA